MKHNLLTSSVNLRYDLFGWRFITKKKIDCGQVPKAGFCLLLLCVLYNFAFWNGTDCVRQPILNCCCVCFGWPASQDLAVTVTLYLLMSPVFNMEPSQYISLPDIETWSICLYLGSFIMFSLLIDALQLWGIHSITCAGCHDLNLVEEALLLLFTVPSKNMCPIQQCPQDTWKQLRNPEKSFSKTLELCIWTLYLLTNSQNLLPETILYYMVHCAWLCMTLRIFVMKENKK